MRKNIIIMVLVLILLTGCSVVRIDTSNIDNILNVVLTKNNKLYNQTGQGYKYYLPGGVTYIGSDDLNDILYSNGTYYYLYIDIVNYSYKSKIDYKEDNNMYYSRFISPELNDKFKYYGYLEITENDNMYYVKFVYNYAKIEVQTTKESLNNVILNSSYILSTIKYNDDIINLMLDEDYFTNKTGKYNNYSTDGNSEKFKLEKENEMVEER